MSDTKGEKLLLSVVQIEYGIIHVPDKRLYELEHQVTNKIVHTTVEIVDIPALLSINKGEAWETNPRDIRNTDALIHVLRSLTASFDSY